MMRLTRALGVCASIALLAGAVVAAQNAPARQGEAQRDEWQKVDEIFKAMAIQPGSVVADIGAGGGFFTSRLSRAVGSEGRVYAVDVDQKQIRSLRDRAAQDQLSNVEVIEGAFDDPKLPAGALDAALIVNAYHEMNEHQAMLAKIKAALKPTGRLVIIEPIAASRRGATRDAQTRSHEIAAEFVQQDARDAGFRVARLEDPFTSRRTAQDEEWLLVLVPASTPTTAATREPPPADDDVEWQAPELRIAVDEFKRLQKSRNVLVLDVRDEESYRQGHLPGAVLMTAEDIATGGAERLRGEKRPIVTYCS